jgi:hypothetical protein
MEENGDTQVELPESAVIQRLLHALMEVKSKTPYHDVVEKHLNQVLEVMAFLQRHPKDGFDLVRRFYDAAQEPFQKSLLVFMASAARECPEVLDFFRKILADYEENAAVRHACVYGLGMANLPLSDFKVKGRAHPQDDLTSWYDGEEREPPSVRWHYATALWALGNRLAASDPADVYRFNAHMRHWPEEGVYGWQGVETRSSILQILVDAFWTEPCPGVRYSTICNVTTKADNIEALVDFFRRAYEQETWVVPSGCLCEGVSPVRNHVVQLVAREAVRTREQIWLDAFRWVHAHESVWDGTGYYSAIAKGWEALGWMDKAAIESMLLPLTHPEVGSGKFPYFVYYATIPLENASKWWSHEEVGQLYLKVATTTNQYADKQFDAGGGGADSSLISHCLAKAKEFATESEIYKIFLSDSRPWVRERVARAIQETACADLADELAVAYERETERQVFEAIRNALAAVAPATLVRLPERVFPPEKSIPEQLDEMLQRGEIDYGTWQRMREAHEMVEQFDKELEGIEETSDSK